MYVITLRLYDGKNYFCGFVWHRGAKVPEWDTDKAYAKRYESKKSTQHDYGRLRKYKASERVKVELAEKFSKN
jgi:hypothetical protein